MKAKRVRFKDSESEPKHPENSRFDVCYAACEVKEDPPMQPAASNEPKTSEFSFFKKLKQDVGHSSSRNTLNRESIPAKDFRPNNHPRDFGNLKRDAKSSQYVSKSTTGEFGYSLSTKDVALQNSAMPNKEYVSQRFKCSPVVRTPTISRLDLFLSTTANASVNPESQQKDGDIFSSKRLKLQQQIAKTLFPDADEVPRECDLVSLLLSRLLPESFQEIPSQNLKPRQPKTKEKFQLHFDSNVELEEDLNTRKLVRANTDHFLDRGVSADQSHRFWEILPSGQTVEGNASVARNSDRLLLGHTKGIQQDTSLYDIAYGCRSERFGDGNLLAWGNELFDYSTPSNTSPKNLKNEAYKQFSNDAFDSNWSCRFKDHSHSFEVPTDSFAAAKCSSHVNTNGIHDFNMDRGLPNLSLSSWFDSSSRVSLEGFRPSSFSNPRDCTESNCVNDFEIRREFCPRLIGWNTDELNVHDSTQITQSDFLNDFEIRREFCPRLIGWNADESNVHDLAQNNHMEIELYHPPSLTCSKFLQDSPPKLEIYCPPSSTWSEDSWVSPEKRNLLHLSPYNHLNHDIQALTFLQRDLLPSSPCIPFKTSYGPEQLNPDDSGLSISRGSIFLDIDRKGYESMENMMCARNSPIVEASPYLPILESSAEFKCKSITGFLTEQYGKHTDNALELSRPSSSSSHLLITNQDKLAIFQPEHRSMTSVHVPISPEDFLPLQPSTL